jgi:ribosomal protein S18 acetylase RimI-like enzyme
MTIRVQRGFPERDREAVVEMYWEAFQGKFRPALGSDAAGIAFLRRTLNPAFAIVAYDDDRPIGVAGLRTRDGSLVQGHLLDLIATTGWLRGLTTGPLLALLIRRLERGTLLMEGLCVHEDARGQGVGSKLLEAVVEEARHRGSTTVRLDVIDTNPRARALYERLGWRPTRTRSTWPLHGVFGFGSVTTMMREVR